MGLVSLLYRRLYVHRYDDEGWLKYLTAEDFPGLKADPVSFDSDGNTLRGFFYSYPDCRQDALIVFCHGIGGGHLSYTSEIAAICRAGYPVLAYDNTGCFSSDGKDIGCLSRSLADLDHAIRYLKAEGIFQKYAHVYVIGHSWGGFAAGNISLYHEDIRKIVVISGFLSVESILSGQLDSMKIPLRGLIVSRIKAFERAHAPEYCAADMTDAVRRGTGEYFLAQSEDDAMVSYPRNIGRLKELFPDQSYLICSGRGHNPNYTRDAVDYMRSVFGAFERNKKQYATPEQKKAYFADTDWRRITAQDPDFWSQVFAFLG